MTKETCMTPRRTTVYLVVGLLFSVLVSAIGNAQETSVPVNAVQLTGLKGIKDNTKGTLSVENGNLHFVHGKENSDVSATSIQDVVTGADSRESVGKTKAGSERARQVTTVSGATSITVHCQFTSPDGTSLLERDVNGKVRFFGGNLRATYDFAKKAANVAHENFSSPAGE
jgi:hypothetical protein